MNALCAPTDESSRLWVLRKLNILDTAPEKEFNDVVRLAAIVCQTPISLISLIDEDRQWFKACIGITTTETKRDVSFCSHTIQQNDILIVPDALADDRFKDLPMVKGPQQIRFYAGVPVSFEGRHIGALCVKDHKPRNLTEDQVFGLRTLATQVTKQLELKHRNHVLAIRNSDMEAQEIKLKASNTDLYKFAHDLMASEEEIRSNLDQIGAMQSHLEVRERQYRELVENAIDLIYELDSTGHFSFVNSTMEKRSGYSCDQLQRKFYWDLVHKKDQERVKDFYKQQRKSLQETSYLQFRMVCASGEKIWIGQNVRMFFDEKDHVTRVTAISRDITEIKRIEHKLADSEKLYRLLSNNSKDLISLFDINTVRKFVSPSVKSILGYGQNEFVEMETPFHYIHPDDRAHVKRITDELTLKGLPATIEYKAVKKDGTIIWLESISNPIFNSSGTLTGFQTSARDITARKDFETSLKEAKEKAEDASKAKRQFLSMMSHEIRTPMNAIIGLTTLMMQNDPRPDQTEGLRLLKFSGENLLTIINDILDFSKIEEEKITLESVDIDMAALFNNAKQMLAQRAQEKGIALRLIYDAKIPEILKGDPVRLAQVLTNLVGNAIKFTSEGFVELSVASVGSISGKHQIRITIKDTGIGIAPDKLDTIFERFSQAETETTRKYGGTGLGLSITKSLLKLMGTDIRVESAPGHGSVFSFDLQLPESLGNRTITPGGNRDKIVMAKGIRVLLVEDNPVNQVVASGFLKRWEISVDIACNGKEAVEMIARKAYQLILMDLQMPEMDGYEATTIIRAMDDPYFKTVPIIALTASAMLGMKDKVREFGITDFVSKPFSPDDLRSKIVKYTAA